MHSANGMKCQHALVDIQHKNGYADNPLNISRTTCVLVLIFFALAILIPRPSNAQGTEIFRHVGNDLKYSFADWPLAVMLGGAVLAGGISLEDDAIQNHLGGKRYLGTFVDVADWTGRIYVVDGAAFLVYLSGKAVKDDSVALTGETLLEALILTQATTMGMKFAFHRERPDGDSRSFPSGHASNAFAVASVLEVLHGPAAGVPAYLIATLISFCRMDQNKHYLSDIVFGAALGSAVGLGTAYFHKQESQRMRIVPMAGNVNGIMLNVTF